MSASFCDATSLPLRTWLVGCSALAMTIGAGCVTCSSTGFFEKPFKGALPAAFVSACPGVVGLSAVVTATFLVEQPASTRAPSSPTIAAMLMTRWPWFIMPSPPSTIDRWSWSLWPRASRAPRSEEHTSELQSQSNLVCRLLLEKKKKNEHRKTSQLNDRLSSHHCVLH